MLEIPHNKDHLGLGYNFQNLKKPAPIALKGSVLPLSEYFSSVSHLVDDHVCALEEDEEKDFELIFLKTEERGATKWTMMKVPEVILIKM